MVRTEKVDLWFFHKKTKLFLFFVIVFFGITLSIHIVSSNAKEVRGVTDDTIKIGIQASMTGPAADHFAAWVGGQ
jgi:hypothetical protein